MIVDKQNIIVTGAGRGLGLEISRSLLKQGASVVMTDIDAKVLDQAVEQCAELAHGSGGRYLSRQTDIADEQDVANLFDEAEKAFGPVTGLVNNAGILRDALLVKGKDGEIIDRMSLSNWQAVIDVNLTGVFLCGREAATKMLEQQTHGVIINISSVSQAGNPGQSNYAAAKAGVTALTVTWARELARHNIRVAAIAPGVFETDMVASMKPEAHDRFVQAIPLKRTGALEELANAVNFIIENDYFTGRVLELDGGLRL